MKFNTDFHDFRGRNLTKEIQKEGFSTTHYLSKAAGIDKALRDGERFETDKFYTKKKFVFRAPQPLSSPAKAFALNTPTENDRINQVISKQEKCDNACFNKDLMTSLDLHRTPQKAKWLL